MKFRHLEYFVAAAEELNFTHAADRLHVSQPPFSKQIHDLEGELMIELFERRRKGVTLTPAGKSFLIDARRILEDCDASIRKAQRISRGEIGELAIGYACADGFARRGHVAKMRCIFTEEGFVARLRRVPTRDIPGNE
jgi:DNA-binding transcriptional LysR family regulator